MFGFICRQATHWERQRDNSTYVCLAKSVCPFLNTNMQTTMAPKEWPRRDNATRPREDRTSTTNKQPTTKRHADKQRQQYS